MRIISHRGYWKKPAEQNKRAAFQRSFMLGYGTETDIRDYHRELVIAHDMAGKGDMKLDDFLKLYKAAKKTTPLALNIKADGLTTKLGVALRKYKISDYFVFDMSIPDMRVYLAAGLKTYARVSDIELEPLCYKEISGIWLDAFSKDWYKPNHIRKFLSDGKPVCLVSPELHKRKPKFVWRMLKEDGLQRENNFTLCTDLPEQAAEFFGIAP